MVSEAGTSLEADVAALVLASLSLPFPGVRLEVGAGAGGPVVRGRVLTLGQARVVRRLAAVHAAAVEIDVIADPAHRLEEGWLDIAGEAPIEVWREPALIGRDHARQTEYLPGDGPLRQLGSREAVSLIQGPDLTLGWVGTEALAPADGDAARRHWAEVRRAQEGEPVLPDPARLSPPGGGAELLAGLLGAARSYLGVPYRWGGTTGRGFDCSGLVQRAFADATGVLLPKHTGDQRHVGVRVGRADGDGAQPGDLLFASPRGRHLGHVMLVSSADTVLHACRTEMRVIEEPLAANAERYQHQGFRRPVLLGP
jgi:cell wall-associated NlpC family hydrolase